MTAPVRGRRRATAPLAVGLAAALALAACTGDPVRVSDPSASPGAGSTSPDPATSRPEPVTLRLHLYGDRVRQDAYRRAIADYERLRPEVTVEVSGSRDAQAAADAVAGAAPDERPDVFLLDQFSLPRFVAADRVLPVDGLLEDRGLQFGDDYQRVALTTFGVDAALQCMPAEMSPLVLFVNRRLAAQAQLRRLGVVLPQTEEQTTWDWEAFTITARAIAELDGPGPVLGAALPPDLETLTALVRSAGGDVVDDPLAPTRLDLASAESVAALTGMLALARDGSVVVPPPEEVGDPVARERFLAGQLGMFVGTRDDLPALRNASRLRFDVLPLPSFDRSRSVSRISGWCLNPDGGRVDAAADLVAYLVGPEAGRVVARTGVVMPVNLAALGSPAFTQPTLPPRNSVAFVIATRRSDPMPYTDRWPELAEWVETLLRRLIAQPGLDLEDDLPVLLERADRRSAALLAPAASPSASPSS